jgi:hypothetical protein
MEAGTSCNSEAAKHLVAPVPGLARPQFAELQLPAHLADVRAGLLNQSA